MGNEVFTKVPLKRANMMPRDFPLGHFRSRKLKQIVNKIHLALKKNADLSDKN